MKLLGKELDFRDLLQTVIFGGSAGSGMLLAYELIAKQPAMVIETFRSWGPLSVLCLVALVMLDRGFRSIVAATEKSSAAQQELADAVHQIAERDNAEAYEQRVLMGHIGTQTEKILTRFDQMEQRMDEFERKREKAVSA